jgi:hypothetical protein
MDEYFPNEAERADFHDWLRAFLRDPDVDVVRWADFLISQHDWFASKRIEISAHQTKSGNPEFYTF